MSNTKTNSVRTFLCVLLTYITVCQTKPPFDMASVELRYESCVDELVYRKLFAVPFHQCITECQLRSRCHHILYMSEVQYCGLIKSTNFTIPQDTSVMHCLYVNVDEVDFSVGSSSLGGCIHKPCGTTERCLANGTFHQCVISECPEPPTVANGTLLSRSMAVGVQTTYSCDRPLILDGPGDLYITCLTSGHWSNPGLSCDKPCPTPYPRIVNSKLVHTSNPRYTVGTILHYECLPPYTAVSTNDTFECLPGSIWRHTPVRCCRAGYELYASFCIKIKVTNTSNDTHADMVKTCSNEGSNMLGVNLLMASYAIGKYAPQVENIMFLDTKAQAINYITNNDWLCLENITGEAVDVLRGQEISELLKHTRTANPPCTCSFASSWHHSQPNSSYEDCLFMGNSTDFLLADISCDPPGFLVGFICYEYHTIV